MTYLYIPSFQAFPFEAIDRLIALHGNACGCKTPEWILMKLGTYNYVTGMTTHAVFRLFKMAIVCRLGFVLFGPLTKIIWLSLSLCRYDWNCCSSFDNILVLIFCMLSLKMPICTHKVGFFGEFDA